jgi:acetamidase/formamidase
MYHSIGFAEDLTAAIMITLDRMLDTIMAQLSASRKEALAKASVGTDLPVTQIANRTLGVHAFWADTALRRAE